MLRIHFPNTLICRYLRNNSKDHWIFPRSFIDFIKWKWFLSVCAYQIGIESRKIPFDHNEGTFWAISYIKIFDLCTQPISQDHLGHLWIIWEHSEAIHINNLIISIFISDRMYIFGYIKTSGYFSAVFIYYHVYWFQNGCCYIRFPRNNSTWPNYFWSPCPVLKFLNTDMPEMECLSMH